MTLTIAKGASVVTLEVPAVELQAIADRGGSLPGAGGGDGEELAATGDDRATMLAATLVVAAFAFLLLPAGVRRKQS